VWGLPWPCVHEFLAIVTHPGIYAPPTPLEVAIDQVDAWLDPFLSDEDRRNYIIITALPLYHIYSLTVNCLMMLKIGGKNVLLKMRWGKEADALVFKEALPSIKFALGENPKRSGQPTGFQAPVPVPAVGAPAGGSGRPSRRPCRCRASRTSGTCRWSC
jgi:hypothetical protein